MNDEWCQCETCGCNGNSECGCEPLNTDMVCALDARGICGCCNAIGADANKRRWNYSEKQTEIF